MRKVHFPCTQGARVRPAPGIPCALSLDQGVQFAKPRADHAAGMLIHVLHPPFDGQIGKAPPQRKRPPEGGPLLKLTLAQRTIDVSEFVIAIGLPALMTVAVWV